MKPERIALIVIAVALIIRFFHYPGAAPLIIMACGSLAMFYFPGGFYTFSNGKIKQQNIALSMVAGIFFSLVVSGSLFRFMYWPGAAVLLMIGVVASGIILIVVYFLKQGATEDLFDYYKRMFRRSIILFITGAFFYLAPVSLLVRFQCWDDPEQARLKTLYLQHPEEPTYREQYDNYMKSKK